MKNISKVIVTPLIRWYEENKRDLPWRADREPYHVWISEIMLQQTRIEAVVRYYARFMDALPDIESLAAVDDDALLKLWEGLGYYSRARNLKKAAQKIITEYGGTFPRTYRDILSLPGIGEYTAGAIASICFDERVAAVDGNVLRVISRLTASRSNVLLPETKKEVASMLAEILPRRSGLFNEALMELGETVCLPNGAPLCDRCPLCRYCAADRENLTDRIPVRMKTLQRKVVDLTVFLIRDPDHRFAIEKRPDSGLLSGLYQLPNIEKYYSNKELYDILSQRGLHPNGIRHTKDAKHIFTHVEWQMKGYAVSVSEAAGNFTWVTEEELKTTYPLPTAFLKMLK